MYYLIGLTLLLTSLFLISVIASLIGSVLWRLLSSRSSGWPATARAATVFLLRVLPTGLGLVYSVGLVVPAFLLYEPHSSDETVGYKQIILVGTCAIGFAIALFRSFGSWWRTRRLVSHWQADSEPFHLKGIRFPAFRIRHDFPVFAVVGAIRPRLFVAEQILETLDEQELAAVVTHEIGHLTALDNIKRVLLQFCGDLLILPIGSKIDSGWVEASEIAADEFAVARGGRHSAVSLASALIKIARLIPSTTHAPAVSAAFAVQDDTELLSKRIRRLLNFADSTSLPEYSGPDFLIRSTAITVCLILFLVPVVLDAYFLAHIHDVSESLLRLLR